MLSRSAILRQVRRQGVTIVSALLVIFVFTTVVAGPAYARSGAMNNAEEYVNSGANPGGVYKGPTCLGGSNDNTGTLWVTDTSGVEGVRVTGNQSTVDVRIYSTVRGCGSSVSGGSYSTLAHISACSIADSRAISFKAKGSVKSGQYYSPPNSTGLPSGGSYRADTAYYIDNRDRQPNQPWSDNFQSSNYIEATIDISGLSSGNQTVCVRGTYSSPICGAASYCKSADRVVGFYVDRTWAVDQAATRAEVQSISGTTSRTEAKVGTTVTWLHTLRNQGPSSTSSNISYLYNNSIPSGAAWSDSYVDQYPTGIGGSIKSIRQGRCMDIDASTLSNTSTTVRQWNCNETVNQLWSYNTTDKTLKVAGSSTKCLNATGSARNSVVDLRTCNGSALQKWNFNPAAVQISSIGAPGQCMDSGAFGDVRPDDNGNVEKLYDCLPGTHPSVNNQVWFMGTQGMTRVAAAGLAPGGTQTFTSRYKIQADDVGQTLCRNTSAAPKAWNDSGWYNSPRACVTVPHDYALVPSVSVGSNVVEPNTDVGVTGTVRNTGSTKSKSPTQYELVGFIVAKGAAVPREGVLDAARVGSGTPCSFFAQPGVRECQRLSYSADWTFNAGVSAPVALTNARVGDLQVGEKMCFSMSVQAHSSTSNLWRYSTVVCTDVSKKPTINITGNDVIVGKGAAGTSDIDTSTVSKKLLPSCENRLYGSWGEYGVFTDGDVSGFASGAGYSGGQLLSTNCSTSSGVGPLLIVSPAVFCKASLLTFTNAAASTCATDSLAGKRMGQYEMNTGFPAIGSAFPIPTDAAHKLGATESLNGKTTGIYTTATNTLNLEASNIPKGKWFVINAPTANVVINGDIKYTTDPLASVKDIPQVVIIANSIRVASNVVQVDSWLAATGSTGLLQTCVETGKTLPRDLNDTVCNRRLTVNGPVIARKANLYRTAGALSAEQTGAPAEVFNMRPDAYLWATNYNSGTPRLQTTSTVERAPRY